LLYPLAFVVLVWPRPTAVAKRRWFPAVVEADGELVKANARLALIGVVVGVVAALPAAAILKLLNAAWGSARGAVVYLTGFFFALRLPKPVPTDPDVAAQAKAEVRRDRFASRRRRWPCCAVAMGYVDVPSRIRTQAHGRARVAIRFGPRRERGGGIRRQPHCAAPARHMREDVILTLSLLVPAVAALFTAGDRETARFAIVAAAVGAGGAAGKIAFDLVQRDAPSATQGRAFAVFETASNSRGLPVPSCRSPSNRCGSARTVHPRDGAGFFGLSHLGAQRRLSHLKPPIEPAADL